VEGTARALESARAAGVRRFVHVGTEAAVFDGHDLIDIDEARPYPERQLFLHSETKAEAERRVLAANDPGGMTTVSIRPRLVWGPRDTTVLPAVLRMAPEGASSGSTAAARARRPRTSGTSWTRCSSPWSEARAGAPTSSPRTARARCATS
jgi:nucleoside-diphosphate-sugar epimerase